VNFSRTFVRTCAQQCPALLVGTTRWQANIISLCFWSTSLCYKARKAYPLSYNNTRKVSFTLGSDGIWHRREKTWASAQMAPELLYNDTRWKKWASCHDFIHQCRKMFSFKITLVCENIKLRPLLDILHEEKNAQGIELMWLFLPTKYYFCSTLLSRVNNFGKLNIK